MKLKFSIILILISQFPLICNSQGIREYDNGPKDSLLNTQLGGFQSRFKDLMNTRGISWYQTQNVTLETISSALSDYDGNNRVTNTGLLFYHHQGDTLYIWLINKNGIQASAQTIVKPKDLLRLETDLKNRLRVDFTQPLLADDRGLVLAKKDTSRENFKYYSKELSSILLPKPISDKLSSIRHLIILPELNIAAIPFYLLQPFGDTSFLIDTSTIVIAHSLDEILNRVHYYRNLFPSLRTTDNAIFTPDSTLVIGNPDFQACSEYHPLEGAQKEAKIVANKFKVIPLINSQATKEEVLKRIKHSEFIYIATHGVADASDPLNKSHLVFSGDKDKCGFWTAKEIQFDTIPYQAIVVLSACQTGLGKSTDAGIIGLGRAFIKAQACNVILSLWSVDDQATIAFMDTFTTELFVPQNFFPAENLRQAILKYKKTNPNPSAWAAFVDMGTPYPPDVLIHMKSR